MKVETYEVEEIKSSEAATMAADSEAIELCEKLGLSGQLSLANPDTDTRNPYRQITALEHLVFKALFPEDASVERYSSGVLPLRVLQVLAHAKDCGMFARFEVWHTLDHREKDPVLVAHNTKNDWDTGHKIYLLARWGDALPSFDELCEKAKKIWIARRNSHLKTVAKEVQSQIDASESAAEVAFTTGKIESHSWYSTFS